MSPHHVMILAVFGLIMVLVCMALKSFKLFSHPARVAISICVAALCVLSLFGDKLPGYSSETISLRPPQFDNAAPPDPVSPKVILLPYLMLMIGLPVAVLLVLCAKFGKRFDGHRHSDKRQVFHGSGQNDRTGATVLKDGKIYEP